MSSSVISERTSKSRVRILKKCTRSADSSQVLPPEVNRILFVRNIPYKITSEDMYDLFGKYGPVRQIRIGTANETKGTAYVVFDDIHDAKNACEHLSGFNLLGRYLLCTYWNPEKASSLKR